MARAFVYRGVNRSAMHRGENWAVVSHPCRKDRPAAKVGHPVGLVGGDAQEQDAVRRDAGGVFAVGELDVLVRPKVARGAD
jgi:hypothetical protein